MGQEAAKNRRRKVSMKWLDTAILHEANVDGPGDGGGASISEGVSDGGSDPAPESQTSDDGGSSTPAASQSAPAESSSEAIQFPNSLAEIFAPRPRSAEPRQDSPSSLGAPAPAFAQPSPPPVAGPSKPDYSLAVTDPEEFAKQLDSYYEARMEAVQNSGMKPVEELKQELQRERQQQWEASFRREAIQTTESMKRHWENVLVKDRDFRVNKDLRAAVQDIIGFFVDNARQKGDIEGLRLAQDPKFYRRSLVIAKDELGIGRSKSYTPGGGPSMAGPQGRQTPGPRLIDADTEAAIAEAAREGYHYTPEQIAKALRNRER